MDIILSKVTQQAMNYAIRSGITITSGYAIQQCSRLLRTVKGTEREELAALRLRLESKIRIISPAIDMIELIAARGNTSLESAVTLTKELRWEIQSLGVRLARAAGEEELARRGSSRAKTPQQNQEELKRIIADIKTLLDRIEDAVPLINLAITTSGVNLSTSLPATVSPSRLLQASAFLTAGDSQYNMNVSRAVQIGPVFTLSMYMLFAGHAYRPHDVAGIRETTWKEVIHKARLKILRVPLDEIYEHPAADGGPTRRPHNLPNGTSTPTSIPSEGRANEFAYQISIVEDLDDDRVHTFEENELQPGPYDDVSLAGIREILPVHEISKIFYADTGKILNIGSEGESNNPILLLKRDPNAPPPRRMLEMRQSGSWYDEDFIEEQQLEEPDEQSELDAQILRDATPGGSRPEEDHEAHEDAHPWRLPPNLDPEWIAFEVYTEEPDTDDEADETEIAASTPPPSAGRGTSRSMSHDIASFLSSMTLRSMTPTADPSPNQAVVPSPQKATSSSIPALRTSLSLLEMLIRLTALQQFQQCSHLAIPDELLTFFLSESATVGAGGDAELRRRVRRDAARHIGFDPYDESPIKRRGEEYLEAAAHRGEAGLPEDGSEDIATARSPLYRHDLDADYPPYRTPGSAASDGRYRYASPYSPRGSPAPTPTGTGSRPGSSSSRDVPLPSREGGFSELQQLQQQQYAQRDPRLSALGAGSSPSPLLRKVATGGGTSGSAGFPSRRTGAGLSSSRRGEEDRRVSGGSGIHTPPSSTRKA